MLLLPDGLAHLRCLFREKPSATPRLLSWFLPLSGRAVHPVSILQRSRCLESRHSRSLLSRLSSVLPSVGIWGTPQGFVSG